MNSSRLCAGLVAVGLLACWICSKFNGRLTPPPRVTAAPPDSARASVPYVPPAPLRLILAPQPDQEHTALDGQIARVQSELRLLGLRPAARLAALDTLGWLFVSKARADYDEGSNKLAEQCALEMDAEQPGSPEATLLRGHVLHQFHRFKGTEILARQLVAAQPSASAYGLLGDALMEQGQLEAAADAYQTMLDLKPGFESYVRAAHFRWLKGELTGAKELMTKASGMVDSHDATTLAWVEQRLALYELQAGNLSAAQDHAEAALRIKPNDAAAHLALGRILSAAGKEGEAVDNFRAAAKANPLPDYLWQLSDHLSAMGMTAEAALAEQTLRQTGRRADPRTFALYLATAGQEPATALQLAEAELESRRDVFSWDALAWSQFAAGQVVPAQETMHRALAEGTQDGRLFLHAAVITSAENDAADKRVYIQRAEALKQMLLPSEQRLLGKLTVPEEGRTGR